MFSFRHFKNEVHNQINGNSPLLMHIQEKLPAFENATNAQCFEGLLFELKSNGGGKLL